MYDKNGEKYQNLNYFQLGSTNILPPASEKTKIITKKYSEYIFKLLDTWTLYYEEDVRNKILDFNFSDEYIYPTTFEYTQYVAISPFQKDRTPQRMILVSSKTKTILEREFPKEITFHPVIFVNDTDHDQKSEKEST
ncbi:hypothetical protein [Methanolapillus africanus]|uniref:hypothetical protein n=1 Tax=Methanolapillus africanus TaxID=3028297 RepID=UPI0030B8E508